MALTKASQYVINDVANTSISGLITTGQLAPETSATPSISSGTLTLDLSTAAVFEVSLTSAITSIVISNTNSSGQISYFVLSLVSDGNARAVTWPASFKWPGGEAPTLTESNTKKDIFTVFTYDGGTSWNAFISGQNV